MTNRIEVLEGDCLGLIAKKYGFSIDAIMALNSDQIKDINLIYKGNTLVLPEPEPTNGRDKVERIALQAKPSELAVGNSTCGTPNFVDILYVPCHPKTQKKAWYKITKEAQTALKTEATTCSKAVTSDKKATLTALTALGIMSRFESRVFEQFLESDEVKQYKGLLLSLVILKKWQGKEKQILHNVEFMMALAKEEDVKSPPARDETVIKASNTMIARGGSDIILKEFTKKDSLVQLHSSLIKDLKQKIKQLEDKAITESKRGLANDGTHFVFVKEYDFFTSEKQSTISECIKFIGYNRKKLHILDGDISKKSYNSLINNLNNYWFEKSKNKDTSLDWTAIRLNVANLNILGCVVKEQCLTLNQLGGVKDAEKGPKCLVKYESFFSWQDSSSSVLLEPAKDNVSGSRKLIIDVLYNETLGGNLKTQSEKVVLRGILNDTRNGVHWAYYPTLTLLEHIELAFKEINANISSVLGNKVNAAILTPQLSKLLWVKMVAKARIEQLKSLAFKNAQENKVHNIEFDNIRNPNGPQPSTYKLIWNESKYKVTEKNTEMFVNKAGKHDLEVTECVLISDGLVGWIRTPCWYLPVNDKDEDASSLCHVQRIKTNITAGATAIGDENAINGTLEDALVAMKKDLKNNLTPKISIGLKKQIASYQTKSSTFWQASYHSQSGVGADGKSPDYAVDAEFQLMRLTSSAEGSLNLSSDEVKSLGVIKETKGGLGFDARIGLELLNGSVTFKAWLPFKDNSSETVKVDDIKGFELNIPYITTTNMRENYTAGKLMVQVTATVYGLVAMTCQVATGINFGIANNDAGMGVRGSTINGDDANVASEEEGQSRVKLAGVAEAKANIDIFAGVEAGGLLKGEVHWQPPALTETYALGSKITNTNEVLKLGCISAQLAMSLGAGGGGEFSISFQGGVFSLLTSARMVVGAGCSGKVVIEIDPINADYFVTCLLKILKQSNFQRLNVFGYIDDEGNNYDFTMLNYYLTMSIALGISFAKALLLPTIMWDDFSRHGLRKELAPNFALRIINPKQEKMMKPWVLSLPPETLAKLFNCLVAEQTTLIAIFNQGKNEVRDDGINNNNQASAMILMMGWLAKSGSFQPRYFEKTIAKMSGLGLSQGELLSARANNWLIIARFVDEFIGQTDNLSRIAFNNNSIKLLQRWSLVETAEGSGKYYADFSKNVTSSNVMPWSLNVVKK